jgi:hypothetical protein
MPSIQPLAAWPRGMREPLAALYIGLSESALRDEVKAGRLRAPIRLTPHRVVYLKDHLDDYLDRAAGLSLGDGNEWLAALDTEER